MFHGHLDYFQKRPLGCRPNTKPGDHGTPNTHDRWFILLYNVWGPTWIGIHWNSIWLRVRSHMTSHYTWGPVTTLHDLEVFWDGLWSLSFGLSQFHGHFSCLMCEVALRNMRVCNNSLLKTWSIYAKVTKGTCALAWPDRHRQCGCGGWTRGCY
jgi:hypothetical protein